MKHYTIYHNPRCSKSRQALSVLREHGINPEVIRYLDTPPTKQELHRLLDLGNLPIHSITRQNETLYKELNLQEASRDSLLIHLAKHPILLQRPIIFTDKNAVVGRTSEAILSLITS